MAINIPMIYDYWRRRWRHGEQLCWLAKVTNARRRRLVRVMIPNMNESLCNQLAASAPVINSLADQRGDDKMTKLNKEAQIYNSFRWPHDRWDDIVANDTIFV